MTTYRLNPDVLFTQLDDDEAVLLHVKTRHYYTLNETGCTVWKHLQSGVPPGAIRDALTQEYDIDAAGAEAYLTTFLDDLQQNGLIEAA